MSVAWKLFADLAERAGDREIPVDADGGETVGDALETLLADRPELADRVRDDDGSLRPEITVLKNGTDVETLDGLETELGADDELALLPPVSGG